MKAAVLRGPGQLACESIPYPELPPDGAILKVEACGICGSDTRAVTYGLRFEKEWQVLGHEIAGVIVEVGRDVTDYAVGDRLAIAADVHCHKCYYCRRALYNLCEDWKLLGTHFAGGMAEYMQLPEAILRRGIVHRLPEGLSSLGGALAEPASSVIASQERLDIQPGEVVVIIGDGPIGVLQVQVAQARGAKPILIGRRAQRLELIRQRGITAWHMLNAEQVDVVTAVRELTGGLGADAAICAAPSKSAQADAVAMVRKRGRIALFGGLPKTDPITNLDSNRIHYDELTIYGTFSYHPSAHQVALDLIARGLIDADKIITATYPIDRLEDAFRAVMDRRELKVMLTPNGSN